MRLPSGENIITINTGEDKTFCIRLYVPHEKWRVDKEYSPGAVVWWNDLYYEYQNVAASTGALPSDTSTWTALSGRKKFDTQYITKMSILVFYQGTNESAFKFSLATVLPAGYGAIDASAAASSLYKISLTKTQTQKIREGVLMYKVKIVEDLPGIGEEVTTLDDQVLAYVNIDISEFEDPA